MSDAAKTAVIKALDWKQAVRGGSYLARGVGILYAIDYDDDFAILAKHEGSSVMKSAHSQVDDAKAAAQADYDARIRSALTETAPKTTETGPKTKETGPKTLEEAWELFDSRRFLHGHRETERESFMVALKGAFP